MARDAATTKRRMLDYINGNVDCINPECDGAATGVEGDSFEVDGNVVTQRVTCNECGWSWQENHQLTAIEEIEDDEGNVLDESFDMIVREPAL